MSSEDRPHDNGPLQNEALVSSEQIFKKLLSYSLNLNHVSTRQGGHSGRDKAILFREVLGILGDDQDSVEALRDDILKAILLIPGRFHGTTIHGRSYTVDFLCIRGVKSATVRTGWKYVDGSDVPIMATCYILRKA